ncbi:MAG: L,D-transpeptidase family protein [Luteolibacter sp.]
MQCILLYLAIATLLVLAVVIFIKWPRTIDIGKLVKEMNLPDECHQILLVTPPSWNATEGVLFMFERSNKDTEWIWVENEPKSIPVTLGRSGMGWGRGLPLVPVASRAEKRESDGRAVAGVFRLGNAFGYAATAPEGTKLPYRQAGEHDYFVDDSTSPLYNLWVKLEPKDGEAQTLWKSAENMKREDMLYELGIVVEHNMHPAEPGMGSAIFLHVWGAPGIPTAGCTAMSRSNMEKLIKWLDPAKNPLLIQAPLDVLSELRVSE